MKKTIAYTLLTLVALASLSVSMVQLQAATTGVIAPGCAVGDTCAANADCGYPPCFCNQTAKQCRDGGTIEAFLEIISQQ